MFEALMPTLCSTRRATRRGASAERRGTRRRPAPAGALRSSATGVGLSPARRPGTTATASTAFGARLPRLRAGAVTARGGAPRSGRARAAAAELPAARRPLRRLPAIRLLRRRRPALGQGGATRTSPSTSDAFIAAANYLQDGCIRRHFTADPIAARRRGDRRGALLRLTCWVSVEFQRVDVDTADASTKGLCT